MTTLALQIFLLLLAAFLVGCFVGCLLKRAFRDTGVDDDEGNLTEGAELAGRSSTTETVIIKPATADVERFERALTGGEAVTAGTARIDEPVVEVRRVPPSSGLVAPMPDVAQSLAEPPVMTPAPAVPEAQEIATVSEPPMAEPAAPETVEPPVAEAAPVSEETLAPEQETVAPAAEAPAGPAEAAPEAAPQEAASYAAIAIASAVAASEAAAAAAPAPPAPPAPLAPVPVDDLQRIRGIDQILQGRLNQSGVLRFSDIAAWTSEDVARMNQVLGFTGRIEQENWIEQAQILARGGETEYARRRRLGAVAGQVATAGEPDASAAAAAAASAVASHLADLSGGPDKFTRIIGIDPETEQILLGLGFTRFQEIARWTSSDIERVETLLGRPGRVGLDNWVEQARVLARFAMQGETQPAGLAAGPAAGLAPPVEAEPDVAAAAPRAVQIVEGPPPTSVEARTLAPPAAPDDQSPKAPSGSAAPAAHRPDLSGLRSVRSEALRGDLPPAGDRHDDLKRIRGVGVLIEKRLNSLGIYSYEQIANWSGADIDRISQILDFKGRIERENWVEQARILASGGQTEFSRRVDRGEVESSRDT